MPAGIIMNATHSLRGCFVERWVSSRRPPLGLHSQSRDLLRGFALKSCLAGPLPTTMDVYTAATYMGVALRPLSLSNNRRVTCRILQLSWNPTQITSHKLSGARIQMGEGPSTTSWWMDGRPSSLEPTARVFLDKEAALPPAAHAHPPSLDAPSPDG